MQPFAELVKIISGVRQWSVNKEMVPQVEGGARISFGDDSQTQYCPYLKVYQVIPTRASRAEAVECPYCKSENTLVWDESRGTVVCSSCGVVVDLVYVNHPSPLEHERESFKECARRSWRRHGLADASAKYLEILEEIKYKSMLYIDEGSFTKYLVLGKRIKVLRRRAILPRSPTLDAIVTLMAKYPRLCSRTDRAKYAIAMIAHALIAENGVDVSKLSRELGLSKTHVKRLVKVVVRSREFLEEAKRILLPTLSAPMPR